MGVGRGSGREAVVFGHRFRPTKRRLAATVLLSAATAGCATLGSNISGSFSCAAPDGICAPSSVIDDRALAMIAGDAPALTPAGPFRSDGGVIRRQASTGMGPDAVALSGPKVLKIVFPSHVDGQGRFHETSVVRAVVDNGAWLAATTGRGAAVASAERLRIEPPGEPEAVAAAPAPVPVAPVAVAAATPPSPARAAPSAAAVAAARAFASNWTNKPSAPEAAPSRGARTAAPLTREAIAAEVRAVASSGASSGASPGAPRNRPTSFSGRVED